MAARVFEALAELAQGPRRGRILIVTHGGVIRVCLARARQLPGAQIPRIAVGHAAIFGLRITPSEAQEFLFQEEVQITAPP